MPRIHVIAARTGAALFLPRVRNIDNFRYFVSSMKRARKIRARGLGERRSELIAEDARAHLFDRALGEQAELERSEGQPDQAVDLKPDVFEHALDLAVLAFAQRHREPAVDALRAIEVASMPAYFTPSRVRPSRSRSRMA